MDHQIFLYQFFCVFLYLLLTLSVSFINTYHFMFPCAHPCMVVPLISPVFLQRSSALPHSIISISFAELFLSLLAIIWNFTLGNSCLCIFFSLTFYFSLSGYSQSLTQTASLLLAFSLGLFVSSKPDNTRPSSIVLQILCLSRSNPINVFFTSIVEIL